MWTRSISIVALLLVAPGCGDDGDGGGESLLTPGDREGACEEASLVGAFEVTLDESFTTIQGKITSAVAPATVNVIETTAGPCRLLRPPVLFCDPMCGAGTTCGPGGICVPLADGISVGDVVVEGLGTEVRMTSPSSPFFYLFLGDLMHPPFAESDEIVLNALGEAEVVPFALRGSGITKLVSPATSVALTTDQPVALAWQAPGDQEAATILIDLNIAQHGGTAGSIVCEVPDTGSFEIPVALTNQLLASGFSGFPSVGITRRSADSEDTAVGCVELLIQSQLVLPVEIDGLVSCSISDDCPGGQTCQPDLTCG